MVKRYLIFGIISFLICFNGQAQTSVDSLNSKIRKLEIKNGQLGKALEDVNIRLGTNNTLLEGYNKMYAAQWDYFSLFISVLGILLAVVIPAIGLISFAVFRQSVNKKFTDLRKENTTLAQKVQDGIGKSIDMEARFLENVAQTNRLIYLSENEDSPYRFRAAYMSLEYYILCYRLKPTAHYDAKIHEASGYLFNIYGGVVTHPHTRPDLYYQAEQSFDFEFMHRTTDLESKTHKRLIELHNHLKKTIEEGKDAIKSRSSMRQV